MEEIGRRLVDRGHRVRVYCRRTELADPGPDYRGMQRVVLPAVPKRSMETLSHSFLSVGHLVTHRTDVAFVFNAANSPLLPALRAARIPVATHVDGLEWQRAKWGASGRRYYRRAEAWSVRWSDALIADADGIAQYYADEFAATTELLTYGAPVLADEASDRLGDLSLKPRGYHLVVARFEPENHVLEAVQGYVRSGAQLPLIVVGSAPYSDRYSALIDAAAGDHPGVRRLGGVWDQDLLDQLYRHALTYVHGHSVGGTNPSLLRALGAGAPTAAWDVVFNREVLREDGEYFSSPAQLARLLTAAEADPEARVRAGERLRLRAHDYDWDVVTEGYEDLARRLMARATAGPQRSRRRPAR